MDDLAMAAKRVRTWLSDYQKQDGASEILTADLGDLQRKYEKEVCKIVEESIDTGN
jgi:hypothetical protein